MKDPEDKIETFFGAPPTRPTDIGRESDGEFESPDTKDNVRPAPIDRNTETGRFGVDPFDLTSLAGAQTDRGRGGSEVALDLTVESTLSGKVVSAQAEDNRSYAGGVVDQNADSQVASPVWSEGPEDPNATSKFAEFRLSGVSDGDEVVFGEHEPAAEFDEFSDNLQSSKREYRFKVDGEEVRRID